MSATPVIDAAGYREPSTQDGDEEDHDLDGLISELESMDGRMEEDEEEDEFESRRGRPVPEDLLQTDTRIGLIPTEVIRRKMRYGTNCVRQEKLVPKYLGLLFHPLQFFIGAVATLSAGLSHWVDFGVLCGLLFLTGCIAAIQKYQGDSISELLQKAIPQKASVLRNGRLEAIPVVEVVPGDILHLRIGERVPADCRIITDDAYLQVDQASLTDESLAVDKYRGDSVFCSTTITRGEAFGVVYATGDSTFVARATSLGSDASVLHEPSRFSHVVNSIVTTLAFLASSFLFMVWISSLYRSNPLLAILQFTLTIAIISIPLSLQAVVMTIVAVGSANLVRKKAVVRNLSAIESLACIDVLCFDKEGILTKQNLVFSDHFCFSGFNQEDLLLTACLTIKRRYQTMDSIEKGVLKTLNNCAHAKDLLFSYKVIKLFPFDLASETRTIIVESVKNERITCVRGTALSVLKIVEEDHVVPKDIRRVYTNKIEELTARGFNTQGVVRKRDDLPWEILGIIPFSYPLRVDSHRTFHKARSLGLDIKMLTKDSVGVARATCRWLGQETNVFDVNMLLKLAGADGYDLVEAADVLARIAPEHKPIVVDFLRERGYKVAITGGNPEDANVLKKADIGIAVHGACDAARWAADVVLLAPGFPAIADAIATSRQVFQRMHSYVLYRVALCLYLEIFFSLWIVILNQSLKPEVIIFIAVLTDIATLATAYDNVPISKGPAQWNLRRIFSMAFVLGVLLTISSWVALTTMFPYRDTKRSQHMTEVDGGIVQNFAVEDAVIFLQVTLLGSWSIFIVRVNGAFWTSFPSWKLSGAVFVTNIIATLFCLFGWFVGGQTSITTIVRVWVYAFGMFCLTGTVFYLAERIAMRLFRSKDAGLIVLRGSAREESGRSKQRSLEDFVVSLQGVSTQHEKSQ